MKFAALAIVGASASYEQEWAEFQAVQGQRNGDIPEAFKRNVDLVKAHNAALNEESTYQLSYTGPFAAADADEYKQVLGYKPKNLFGDLPQVGEMEPLTEDPAESVDWESKGAVTPVKNQGNCGSCWAFSTIGSLEGAWQLSSGKLVSLSEQQLVDCSKQNQGCNGGLMDYGFDFLKGVDTCTEETYPYTAKDGSCDPSSCTAGVPKGAISGYVDVTGGEDGLLTALQQRPVSVAIEADQFSFQIYHSGVLTGRCGEGLDHGVLVVGYGTEAEEEGLWPVFGRRRASKYWKVKNSWGGSWGENGYIRIERGTNKCGISNEPSYPTLSSGEATVV